MSKLAAVAMQLAVIFASPSCGGKPSSPTTNSEQLGHCEPTPLSVKLQHNKTMAMILSCIGMKNNFDSLTVSCLLEKKAAALFIKCGTDA